MNNILNILKNKFNFDDFKNEEQKLAIESLVNGECKNVIMSMAPNSGKSLCYMMPRFFIESGVVLVISPFIERIVNKIEYLSSLEIPATSITSETSKIKCNEIIDEFRSQAEFPYYFLYVTPDMIMSSDETLRNFFDDLLESQVCLIAVDEVQASDDDDFNKLYLELKNIRSKFEDIPWIVLTTASIDEMESVACSLSMTNHLTINGSCALSYIFIDVISNRYSWICTRYMISDIIMYKGNENKIWKFGIIYCRNPDEADKVAEELCSDDIPSLSYHLLKVDKDLILRKWKDGYFPVLVTHEGSFNMGVSRSSLEFVLFMAHPKSLKSFYHRSARINETGGHSRILDRNSSYNDIKARNYIRSSHCRHKSIIDEISEDFTESCENKCDNCVRRNRLVFLIDDF